MTIFQKMLAVPVLALFLYGGFLYYSYTEYQQTSGKIEAIRDQYLPLLEVANENNHLFDEIRSIFKDAVLAGESAWLPNTTVLKQQITENLKVLEQHPKLIDQQQLQLLQQSFSQYYDNALALAQTILSNEDSLIEDATLVQNVERYHNETNNQFSALKQSIQQRFRNTVDDTNQVMQQLLFIGGSISIAIMLFILGVTLAVSLSTRRSLNAVVLRMRAFALGDTDFSRRLQRKSKDELGYLIHWFNKLSDKLEQDYIKLETISITDKLTQLNNRCRTDSYFPQALANAKAQGQALAVLVLDIDHFKKINDNFGHLIGDEVLKAFADILKQMAAPHDFIGRWGGEEFIMMLPDADANSARAQAEKIRMQVQQHEFPEVGQVTASFGIALSTADDSPTSIVKRADDCLYLAKERGRNCVILQGD